MVGFDYVHSLVDDHSRLAYSEVLSDEKGPTCAAFLERAIAYFADHGITRIERLITDNAWVYRYSLRTVCAAHGLRQKFIKPHCPWQNGKVERLNRTLQNEWAYRQSFASNDARTAALAPWVETTTMNDATQPSEATPRSADCNQRHDRVQLCAPVARAPSLDGWRARPGCGSWCSSISIRGGALSRSPTNSLPSTGSGSRSRRSTRRFTPRAG